MVPNAHKSARTHAQPLRVALLVCVEGLSGKGVFAPVIGHGKAVLSVSSGLVVPPAAKFIDTMNRKNVLVTAKTFFARSMPAVTIAMISPVRQVDEKFCLSILALSCREPQPSWDAARLGRGSPFHSLADKKPGGS
jgi:hypothetical protein